MYKPLFILFINYLAGFCMGGRSVERVRLNRYIGKIWIIEISIASLFNFFVGVVVFIINVFLR